MSSKVDDRIVNMRFNNDQFAKGVAETNKSLESLKRGLDLKGAARGLSDLASAGKNFTLNGLANGVEAIASKFNALSVIGVTALANIANKAINVGSSLLSSLTIDPIKAGFDEYELKMGSIQTILANTARYGTSLQDVTGALDQLNEYADKTIYNFGDMTKNIGLFTNAGIRVEDATSMIKGFSNAAAASGTSAQGAAGAAYQLSQALSAGTIRLMDWRSLTNVGMGNKNMQTGLIEIADAMGTLEANSITATDVQADFNGSLEKNWLSADVMSSYLKIMAGDMDDASMAALGLSETQIQAFKEQQATAQEAATKVRTWTQLVGTLQEGVGSSWAQTFDILIGDFNAATELFTNISNTLGGMISSAGDARNELLKGWADRGGRDIVIEGMANAFEALMAILKPVKEAFSEIFPPITVTTLLKLTSGFRDFTASLMPSAKTLDNIKSTAKGFFAVLDIGWMIIKGVAGVFGRLFSAISPVGGGVLSLTGNIGDFIVKIRDAIKSGDGFAQVFKVLGDVLVKPIELLRKFGETTIDSVKTWNFAKAWEGVGKALQAVGTFLKPVGDWFVTTFAKVKEAVTGAFQSMDFGLLVGLLNVGMIGGVIAIVKKFTDGLPDMFKGIGGGIFDSIKGVFTGLTDALSAMQTKLKAEALKQIAISIGILAAALLVLSFVDSGRIVTASLAMTVLVGELALMMKVLESSSTTAAIGKMPIIAASLGLLAGALLLMSVALKILSTIKWDEMIIGLVGMGVGLGLMTTAMSKASTLSGKMIVASLSYEIMARAMLIMAFALKAMASLSWEELLRGLSGLAGVCAILVTSGMFLERAAKSAPAMLIMSVSLAVLGVALAQFADLSWEELVKGLATLGGVLVLMALGLKAMEGSVLGATAMLIVSAGMIVMSEALARFAEMDWDEIVRSLVVLGGGLAILAGAMAIMGLGPVALGSVALLAASAGLMMLAPALVLLGGMSWDDIGRGLTMLGASLAILAVGGLLMIPASVGFLLLGVAILALGAGVLMAANGLLIFAAAVTALAAAAVIGSEAIKKALIVLAQAIPEVMTQFAKGIIEFAKTIAQGGVEFTAAMVTLLQSLIDAINQMAPQVVDMLFNLLQMLVDKLVEHVPILVQKGADLIIGILDGISSKVPEIARAGTDLMIALMDAVAAEGPRLADAGMRALVDLVNGVATAVENNSGQLRDAGGRLAVAIIDGMTGGIFGGIDEVISAAQQMASDALNAAKNFLGINSPSKEFKKIGEFVGQGFVLGINGSAEDVEKSFAYLRDSLSDAMRQAKDDIKSHTENIERMTEAQDDNNDSMIEAVKELKEIRRWNAVNAKKAPKDREEAKSTKQVEKRIKQLKKTRDENNRSLRESQRIVKQAEIELVKYKNARTKLQTSYQDEKNELKRLANYQERTTARIKDAEKAYSDAVKTRDDYSRSIKNQYSNLESIDGKTKLKSYTKGLSTQIAQLRLFAIKVQEVRDLGLNDTFYQELLAKGPEALPFIEELIQSGGAGVDRLNYLQKTLMKEAGKLGNNASKELYQAGVDSSKSLLDGLRETSKTIAEQMKNIGKEIVKGIQEQLNLGDAGKKTGREFIKALKNSVKPVEKSAKKVGDGATKAISGSINNMAKQIDGNLLDRTPVIKPVLDLSKVKEQSKQMPKIIKAPDLKIPNSIRRGNETSKQIGIGDNKIRNTQPVETPENIKALPAKVVFNQNNYSPKALSNAEIYRRTSNQISVAKKELTAKNAK